MVRNYYLSRKWLTSPNVSVLNHAVLRRWQQSLKLCLSPEGCIALELVEHFSEGTRSDWAEVSFIGMEHELKIKAFSYHVMLIDWCHLQVNDGIHDLCHH